MRTLIIGSALAILYLTSLCHIKKDTLQNDVYSSSFLALQDTILEIKGQTLAEHRFQNELTGDSRRMLAKMLGINLDFSERHHFYKFAEHSISEKEKLIFIAQTTGAGGVDWVLYAITQKDNIFHDVILFSQFKADCGMVISSDGVYFILENRIVISHQKDDIDCYSEKIVKTYKSTVSYSISENLIFIKTD